MDELYALTTNNGNAWTGMQNYGNPGLAAPANFGTMDFMNTAPVVGLNGTAPIIGNATGGGGGGLFDGWFSKDAILGKNGQQGWGNLALGALNGIGGAYMGMKQYGLAKDALAQSQAQFNKNYNAQRQSMNTQLEDRQRARVAATDGRAESVESYMNRNRIN